MTSGRGHPLEYQPTNFFVSRFIDLRSGFGRRMQLLQVYRSGSTRSVFIIKALSVNLKDANPCFRYTLRLRQDPCFQYDRFVIYIRQHQDMIIKIVIIVQLIITIIVILEPGSYLQTTIFYLSAELGIVQLLLLRSSWSGKQSF